MNWPLSFHNTLSSKWTLSLIIGAVLCQLVSPHIAIGLEESAADRKFAEAVAAHRGGETKKAIDRYGEVIRLDPGYSRAYFNRGLLRHENQEFQAAATDFAKAASIDSKDATAHYALGNVLDDLNQLEAAEKSLTEAIRLDPTYLDALFTRARVRGRQQENAKAIEDLDRILMLDPKSVDALLSRGRIRVRMSEYEKARADMEKAIEYQPDNSAAVIRAAWLFSTCPDDKIRDGKRAVVLAAKGCKLTDWKDADAIAALASSYACVDDFQNAVLMQRKALEIVPEGQRELYQSRLKLFEMKMPLR